MQDNNMEVTPKRSSKGSKVCQSHSELKFPCNLRSFLEKTMEKRQICSNLVVLFVVLGVALGQTYQPLEPNASPVTGILTTNNPVHRYEVATSGVLTGKEIITVDISCNGSLGYPCTNERRLLADVTTNKNELLRAWDVPGEHAAAETFCPQKGTTVEGYKIILSSTQLPVGYSLQIRVWNAMLEMDKRENFTLDRKSFQYFFYDVSAEELAKLYEYLTVEVVQRETLLAAETFKGASLSSDLAEEAKQLLPTFFISNENCVSPRAWENPATTMPRKSFNQFASFALSNETLPKADGRLFISILSKNDTLQGHIQMKKEKYSIYANVAIGALVSAFVLGGLLFFVLHFRNVAGERHGRLTDLCTSYKDHCQHCPSKNQLLNPVNWRSYFTKEPWRVTFGVGAFFGVLAWQMAVGTYLRMRAKGDYDMCAFDERCYTPGTYGTPTNSIYSNAPYLILGLLGILAVLWTDRDPSVPPQGPIQPYAKAAFVALMAEGVNSAAYHVCPSVRNFQIDVSFMFVSAFMVAAMPMYLICITPRPMAPKTKEAGKQSVAEESNEVRLDIGIEDAEGDQEHISGTSRPGTILLYLGVLVILNAFGTWIQQEGDLLPWVVPVIAAIPFAVLSWGLWSDTHEHSDMSFSFGLLPVVEIAVSWFLGSGLGFLATFLCMAIIGIIIIIQCKYIIPHSRNWAKFLGICFFGFLSVAIYMFFIKASNKSQLAFHWRDELYNDPSAFCSIGYDSHDLWHMFSAAAMFCLILAVHALTRRTAGQGEGTKWTCPSCQDCWYGLVAKCVKDNKQVEGGREEHTRRLLDENGQDEPRGEQKRGEERRGEEGRSDVAEAESAGAGGGKPPSRDEGPDEIEVQQ